MTGEARYPISKDYVMRDGVWVEGEPAEGEDFKREIEISKGAFITKFGRASVSEPELVLIECFTKNEVITSSGVALQGLNNTYYAPVNTEIQLQADIVDALGSLQTQIDQVEFGYPPILKMPVVKMAGGINGTVIDEVYFTVTLNGGVLTATGTLPTSGDWKLLTERVNASLASINANWKVKREVTTFLA